MIAQDLAELLLAHRAGGAWRAPLGRVLRPVPAPVPARIVEGDAADCARAAAGLAGAVIGPPPDGAAALATVAPVLAPLRAAEDAPAGLSPAAAPLPAGLRLPLCPPDAPVLILGTRAASPALVAHALCLCAHAGRAVLFKPAPRAAASGAVVVRALVRASDDGWPTLALVQGGGATGRLLLAAGGWGGVLLLGAAAPRAGLPRGVLVLPDPAAAD